MGRRKVGGFVFEWYSGDHRPLHVHVFKDGIYLGRFDIESGRPMKGLKITDKLKKVLMMAGFLGKGKK